MEKIGSRCWFSSFHLWCGCPDYLLAFLQSLQNRAARLVSNKGRYTPINELLKSCGWLSIRQLVAFHRVVLLFKIKYDGKPKYLNEKFSTNPNPSYNTRFQDDGQIRKSRIYKKEESKSSFVPDSISVWNRLPTKIRKSENPKIFKTKLKPWIVSNIKMWFSTYNYLSIFRHCIRYSASIVKQDLVFSVKLQFGKT